jgi:hypothetical protein
MHKSRMRLMRLLHKLPNDERYIVEVLLILWKVVYDCETVLELCHVVLPRLLTLACQVDFVKSTQVESSRVTHTTPTDFGVEPKLT